MRPYYRLELRFVPQIASFRKFVSNYRCRCDPVGRARQLYPRAEADSEGGRKSVDLQGITGYSYQVVIEPDLADLACDLANFQIRFVLKRQTLTLM